MNRRYFLQTSALLASSGLVLQQCSRNTPASLQNIGVQLFSLPKLLENDFRKAIGMLAQIGYREIEMYGPFPFSAASAKERWNAVTPTLGFSGSGYFGLSQEEVSRILAEHQMSAPSIHTDLDTLENNMGELGEAANALGHQYVCLPAIPGERRKTTDDYRRIADTFNRIGEEAKKAGLKFAYHNHGYGLKEMDGKVPLKIILDSTDPALVFLEMDIYWTTAGGADPVAYLDAYPDRYHLMHVKDMKQRVQFSGDGGDPNQWVELFPYMTTAGNGVLDLEAIIEKARKSGVRHFFVEQDMVSDPDAALRTSFDYLQSLKKK